MNEDKEVYVELADDEHTDAEAAAEDTARLLLEVRNQRIAKTNDDGTGMASEAVESQPN